MSVSGNVYSIPAWQPFVRVLVQYLLDKTRDKPESLTSYLLLLPTRRTCRIMQEAFLDINDGKPLLLPQMVALGDIDEEDLSLMSFSEGEEFLEIPKAISPLRRQLLLAKLICAAPDFSQGMDQALSIANALGNFIDQVVVEGLDFSKLSGIVPDKFSEHWQITLNFLKIISENWPYILNEQGVVDGTERRNMLLNALSDYWQRNPPSTPVIAAGTIGSIPAVANLLRVISGLDEGMVILPGLDMDMDDEDWGAIEDTHPQNSLKILLERINIGRKDVNNLDIVGVGADTQRNALRHKLASTLMLPAMSTHKWHEFSASNDIAAMLEGFEYYSCNTQQEEAALISLIMREILQTAGKVCALVTPDRVLARRVRGCCQRWGIEVDDSAGVNLCDTPQGKFVLLCLNAARGEFDPVNLLALMKNRYCRVGRKKEKIQNFVQQIEGEVLRQGHIIASHDMFRKLVEDSNDLDIEAKAFVREFYCALDRLADMCKARSALDSRDLIKAHIECLEALASLGDDEENSALWRGDIGKNAALFFSGLLDESALLGNVFYEEYINILTNLMRSITIRVPYGSHPRLLILGQLEARLTKADIVIMGGMNEGVWPSFNKHDPWMSRPMRADFGLPSHDQMIGIAAHDFVQGLCSARVVVTRSQKVGGSPTIPSRWISRLEAVLLAGYKDLESLSVRPYLQWVREIDKTAQSACKRPEPRPPVCTRPKLISITKVETWLKDPYSIYMYYILGIKKVKALRQESDALLKGNVLHKILDEFVNMFPNRLPQNAREEFLSLAKTILEQDVSDRNLINSWWPNIEKITDWYILHEQEWRQNAKFVASEISGSIDFDIEGTVFSIYGTADRIDKTESGYAIIDYKSGGSFTKSGLKAGNYPQLPLEGLILEGGGFDGRGFGAYNETSRNVKGHHNKGGKIIDRGECTYVGYWMVNGGREVGKEIAVDSGVADTMAAVYKGVTDLFALYQNEDMPFICTADISNLRYNDYEHVSRLKEWSVAEDDNSGEEGDNG